MAGRRRHRFQILHRAARRRLRRCLEAVWPVRIGAQNGPDRRHVLSLDMRLLRHHEQLKHLRATGYQAESLRAGGAAGLRRCVHRVPLASLREAEGDDPVLLPCRGGDPVPGGMPGGASANRLTGPAPRRPGRSRLPDVYIRHLRRRLEGRNDHPARHPGGCHGARSALCPRRQAAFPAAHPSLF